MTESLMPWEDALTSAALGLRVGIFAHTLTVAQEFLSEVADRLGPGDQPTVRRVHGAHSISFRDGGKITFHGFRGGKSFRGTPLDRAYIPVSASREQMLSLVPCLETGKNPAFIGYF